MFRIKTYRESAERTILLKCTMGRRGELSQMELFGMVLLPHKLNITILTMVQYWVSYTSPLSFLRNEGFFEGADSYWAIKK